TIRMTLERPLASSPADLEKLPQGPPANQELRRRVAIDNYRRANNFVLATAEARPSANRFACPLEIPAKLPWTNLVVRACAMTKTDSSLGVIILPVTAAADVSPR